ncbi:MULTISPECIES: hypothetical protein [unclassified Methanoregula]|uniref:hypothetical protein n=1 Tax=unclassified Methanoregula TaxID=2649730 RepID=UPI0025FAEEA3|nr:MULTISPECIES: hypothetical protein [unclassified Methanoregula]
MNRFLLSNSPRHHSGRRPRADLLPALAAAAFFLLLVLPAMATAPSNITITYNPDMHRLFVTVTHPTENPETHYIRGVQVKINGEVISDPVYKNQTGRTSFTRTYDVMANPGDSVWVVATCIQGQSLEAHTEIRKPGSAPAPVKTASPSSVTFPPATAAAPAAAQTTYADAGLFPLFGAAVVLILRK